MISLSLSPHVIVHMKKLGDIPGHSTPFNTLSHHIKYRKIVLEGIIFFNIFISHEILIFYNSEQS